MAANARRHTANLAKFCAVMSLSIAGCTSVPLKPGGSLTSYDRMTASGGTLTKADLRVETGPVLSAKTVRIVPTAAQFTSGESIDPVDLALLRNTIDRALCTGLSDRFVVVDATQPADITVRASIVNIVKTSRTAAATSTIASLGASVALPVPIPRIPLGLGGLAVEAEAIGQDGTQLAAILWSRGANMLTNKARISEVGDAYSLSSAFGADFSRLLVTGKDPFKSGFSTPSMQKIYASLGGSPKYEACNAFGRAPGVRGLVTGQLGLPPEWTDKGAAAPR